MLTALVTTTCSPGQIGRHAFGSETGGLHGAISEGDGDVDVAHPVHVEGLTSTTSASASPEHAAEPTSAVVGRPPLRSCGTCC